MNKLEVKAVFLLRGTRTNGLDAVIILTIDEAEQLYNDLDTLLHTNPIELASDAVSSKEAKHG